MNKHKLVIEHPHDNIKQKQSPFIKFKSHFSSHFHSHQSAFTIVELLVVIVVIGILATVVFVSYSGVTKKATEAVIKSDLNNNGKLLELYQVENGSYPTTLDAVTYCPTLPIPSTNHCLKASNGNTLSYTGGERYYSLIEANPTSNISYTVTETGTIAETISTFAYAWGGSEWDHAYSITSTADGGYVMAGETDSFGAGDSDAYLTKFTNDGSLVWDRTWGGSNTDYGDASSIVTTNDGGYVIAGSTSSFGDGSIDAFIAKFTSDGNLVWNRTWGGSDTDYSSSIVATADGGCILAGHTRSFGAGSGDVFLAKFTSDGTLSWDKTWGGTGSEYVYAITATDDGYVIAGRTASFGAGSLDAFLAKFTSEGSLVWDETWGGTGSDYAESVIATVDGNYVLSGYTASFGAGSSDAFIAKFTDDGSLVWDKTWGGVGSDNAYSIINTVDSGYVITGFTKSFGVSAYDTFIAKFTGDGTLVWNKTWGGAGYELINSIVTTADGGYMMIGYTDSVGGGDGEAFFAKFSANGVLANCLAPMCQDPVVNVADPIATIKDIDASESYPDVVEGDPLASVNDPTATITTIVAP